MIKKLYKVKALLYLLLNCKGKISKEKSKSYFNIVFDLIRVYLLKSDLLKDYFVFGAHLMGNSIDDYFSKKDFFKAIMDAERKKRIHHGIETFDYSIIVKDKFIFNSVLKANGFSCIEPLGIIHNGFLYKEGFQRDYVLNGLMVLDSPVVIKNSILEYNEGVFMFERRSEGFILNGRITSNDAVKNIFEKGFWIIQKVLSSHAEIRKVNTSALNSTDRKSVV